MSGHNKWSSIKNKKGKEDAKRGKAFTKVARIITVAVREGGPEPEYNPSLKSAIEQAKSINMPNDNIERAIKKAAGGEEGSDYVSKVYEGYGPGGVAVIVDCLTDNVNRTASDVRHLFDRFGGNLGTDGSVMYLFEKKGVLRTENKENDFDKLMMDALEAGAEDVVEETDSYIIYTDRTSFNETKSILSENGYKFDDAEVSYIPSNYIDVDESKHSSLFKLIDALEDDDDVQGVYTNWNVPEESQE
ncbi:MAG: YebC/PmpR family DNA-binding transcriptional regulator [Peptoniphilaceae bacterium]|nr:YebC/PmpR family DNA-binding transcriptional regulator [Peptoniphilaceae bacterium]MDD7383575.1 YebC/PmpR family DNA-binding transcriptional regulator [Peptoniphilaceae bacterium]MDY3738748.1 YebC/PmpR family DNA-binding transcriptional regulator [Peptoniphilaceae bacterium]